MDRTMIAIDGASKRFGDVVAVDRATLDIDRGEFVALLGPSGCGKTTLLRLIAGFDVPDTGSIAVAGRTVAGGAWVPPERRAAAMVFQDYALFPHLTVAQNVGFGVPRRRRAERTAAVLELVGLRGLESRYPHELSGGQQQRVALARALAPQPAVVLLDEPWSNIDPLRRAAMREDVAAILRAADVTVLLVTHDREEAFSLADRIALMREGRIEQTGRPEQLYYEPASRWSAEFVGASNILAGRIVDGCVDTAFGSFPVRRANGRTTVDVLVRPELLELVPDEQGVGEVVGREFRGHDVFYRVRFADGTTVCSQRPSTEDVALGARVTVRPHKGPVAVLP
ncbi:MAG TPA: ABC transporter ATP-binding protein [Gaiellaceae bacterium]|nr:ABC transporter ATP-binding protein [Gaiellaceae bacterium]